MATLYEELKKHQNEFIYIGSKSGFIFIGNPKDAVTEIANYDTKEIKKIERFIAQKENLLKTINIERYAKDSFTYRQYQNNRKILAEYKKRLEERTSLLDREVMEVYPHNNIEPYGIVIKVEGEENANCWTWEEYQYGKRGKR